MSVMQSSPADIYQRAKTLYEQNIRAQVENSYDGKIIMIDVDSGDYEIDDVGVFASERLRQKHPNALLCALRIGYEAVDGFGGGRGGQNNDAGCCFRQARPDSANNAWIKQMDRSAPIP